MSSAMQRIAKLSYSLSHDSFVIPNKSVNEIAPNMRDSWEKIGIDHNKPFYTISEVEEISDAIRGKFAVGRGKFSWLATIPTNAARFLSLTGMIAAPMLLLWSALFQGGGLGATGTAVTMGVLGGAFVGFSAIRMSNLDIRLQEGIVQLIKNKKTAKSIGWTRPTKEQKKSSDIKSQSWNLREWDQDSRSTRIVRATINLIGEIYNSPLWDNPSYSGLLTREELQYILRDITDRAEKIKDLSNKNFLLSESMPENTFDNYKEEIETALETLALEVLELEKYLENMQKLEKEYRILEKYSEIALLGDSILEEVSRGNSSVATRDLGTSNKEITGAQKAIRKITEAMYQSSLIFRPGSKES